MGQSQRRRCTGRNDAEGLGSRFAREQILRISARYDCRQIQEFNGSTIDAREALSLGLISDIVETRQELTQRCVNDIQVVTATPHRHLLKYHRQHVLPSASEMETALERYYDAMARSIIQLRMNR